MVTIHVPNDNPQDAINVSQPGDTLVFDTGVYVLDEPLHLQGDRTYFSQDVVIFRMSPDFQHDPGLENCMIIFSGSNTLWSVKSIMDTGRMQ